MDVAHHPALWVEDIDYARARAHPGPVFLKPSARNARWTLLRRAVRHPATTARIAAAARHVPDVAAAWAWWETATAFAPPSVVDATGAPAPVAPLLSLGPAPSVRATSAPAPAITGVLMVQDEEREIGPAIDSLAPYVDEVVVLDGGSSDDTIGVAAERGATVHSRAFAWDFADQRNALLGHVRTPWVFSLDADERVPPELGELVRSLLIRVRTDALVLPRVNLLGDADVPDTFPDVHARVFRSHLRYVRPVHEQLVYATAVHLPVNGPSLLHRKAPLKHWSSSLRYNEIDPSQSTPGNVAWMQTEVARLRGEQDPG